MVGQHPLGIGLYLSDCRLQYRDRYGYGRHFGEMAVEVEAVMPEGVSVHPDGYTMVDCALSPILWRLSYFDVQLPTSAAPLLAYATRLFDRKAFVASLTTEERGLNE